MLLQMEFRSLHEDLPGPVHPQDIRRRLELTLSLWARPSPWQDREHFDPPQEQRLDAEAWASFVTRATPVDPVSTASGLTEALRRHNANREASAPEWTLASTEADGITMTRGSRVAVRSLVGLRGPTFASAHPWRLALDCEDAEADELAELCRDTFAVIDRGPGGISVGEPHPVVDQAVAVIGRLAFGVTSADELVVLWRKAKALGVAATWLPLLSPTQRRALAGRLADIVISEAPSLDWLTDRELETFAQGRPHEPGHESFPHKVDEAFRAHWVLAQTVDSTAPECVFAEMAEAVALAGDATQVGNLLHALRPGRAYFAAIDALRTHRAGVIASLLWHFVFSPDGLVAIADWPDYLLVQGEGRMSMQNEWETVGALSRRLALFHDRGPDYVAALALAAHEETLDGAPGRTAFGRTPTPSATTRMKPWEERLEDAEHAARAVAAIRQRLAANPRDPDFVLALRVLAIVEKPHPSVAVELAEAFAGAYAIRFDLNSGTRRFAPRLGRHGDLLATLHRVASAAGPDSSGRWRRPFDVANFVTRSHEPVTVLRSDTVTPRFDVPRMVHAHARHLISAALGSSAGSELVHEVVSLFEETHGKLGGDAWSWDARTEDEETPIFMDLGRALARLPAEEVTVLVDRVLEAAPTPLQLAELLSGLGSHSTAAGGLRARLARKVGPLVDSGELARGHGNALGMALYYAGLPDLAERAARYVLTTLEGEQAFAVSPIRDTAIQVLAAAWVAQGKWNEMDAAQLTASDPKAHLLIENLRALADLEQKKPDDALGRLGRLLARHPTDPMALSNVAAVHASRSDWSECLAACRHARQLLGEKMPPEASVSEAQACHQLRDFRGAADALSRLPRSYAQRAEIISLRVALATATSPVMDEFNEDLRALALTDPSTADLLRSRIAMMAPIEVVGGWMGAGGLERRHVSFVERCEQMQVVPETFLMTALTSAGQRISEDPSLALELNEDQLTRQFCTFLIGLERFDVSSKVLAPGGWGPAKEGIADFLLTEGPAYAAVPGRRIVRGEAKRWKGAAWMTEGLKQILGTGNTGQELFLCLVVYSDLADFGHTAAAARDTLSHFGKEGGAPFAIEGGVNDAEVGFAGAIRSFKTLHRERNGDESSPTRTVYTLLVDIASAASRAVRM